MELERQIEDAVNGNREALLSLVMEQKDSYYRLAFTYMKNEDDAMDVLEDMIVILYDSIGKLKKKDAFYAWSKTILVNCCKRKLRQKKKLVSLAQPMEVERQDTGAEQNIRQVDDRLDLEKHLNSLSEKHREIIKLRYYLDMDYLTISQIMEIPQGTVKSRISTAISKLKKSFGGENR